MHDLDYKLLCLAIIAQAVSDYTDAVNGNIKDKYTAESYKKEVRRFFESDFGENVCILAEVTPKAIIRRLNEIERGKNTDVKIHKFINDNTRCVPLSHRRTKL